MLQSIRTRFRAYQLDSEGASFSYFADPHFTLIEARLNDVNYRTLRHELRECGKERIDTLHITSWDADHCATGDLERILSEFCPSKIEYPGYEPHCGQASDCLDIVKRYEKGKRGQTSGVVCQRIDPAYIAKLGAAEGYGYRDIFYHPTFISESCNNDNSTVKLFRRGSFNVASLGDVESVGISAYLKQSRIFCGETDVMILAHHGADNGFTTSGFLKHSNPTIAICSSNYDNKFEHPRQDIRDLLYKQDIPIFTTKTGDVIVESIEGHRVRYRVVNLISGSEKVSSTTIFASKKSDYLRNNADSIRNRAKPGFKGLK